MKKPKRIIILVLVIAILISVYGINEFRNSKVVLTKYEFPHENVPKNFDGFKIMVISDLHNAPFSEQISKHIKAADPDVTIFAGDMVQLPEGNLSQAIKIVENTKDVTTFYAITGNHDMQNSRLWEIIGELESAGVCMIDSRYEVIEREGERIALAGFADPMDEDVGEKQIRIMRNIIKEMIYQDKMFTVLANHRSVLYPYIKDLSADLILSGHLHGGVARLPFVGGLVGEKAGHLFPEYEYSFYEGYDDSSMIVSGGCDKNPKKKRIFNPPEIVLVTLKSE